MYTQRLFLFLFVFLAFGLAHAQTDITTAPSNPLGLSSAPKTVQTTQEKNSSDEQTSDSGESKKSKKKKKKKKKDQDAPSSSDSEKSNDKSEVKIDDKKSTTGTDIKSESEEEEEKTESSIFKSFKNWVMSVRYFLFDVSMGPRANRQIELPPEFKQTPFVVRNAVADLNLIYVEALPNSPAVKEGDSFFAFIREDNSACEVVVKSIIERWLLIGNKNCQRFAFINHGDYLIKKTSENKKIWKPRYSNDYMAAWYQFGETNMKVKDISYSGSNQRYGARAAMDLSPIARAQINYGVGKNDLSDKSTSVQGSFQGTSLSSFHVTGRWSEKWQYDFEKVQIVPMIGIGTIFEDLEGHPTFDSGGGGPTLALFMKSSDFKTALDLTFNYCIINCKITEVGTSAVAVYDSPEIMEFRITTKSDILPWAGFGILASYEYYSFTADKAYINSENTESRKYDNSFSGFSLGISYSWN